MSTSMRALKSSLAGWMSRLPATELLDVYARTEEPDEPIVRQPTADEAERDRIAAECRGSFLAWCTEALRHEGLSPAAHHRLLCERLQDVALGRISKLMIFMPPGSAKSKYTSEMLPEWFMAARPGEPVIGASHTGRLALRFSGRVQRYIRAFEDVLGFDLVNDAKERWENSHGAEYLAAGVGGAIPGYRAGLAIVDDPYPGRAEADSENYRERVWEWWNADLQPRLKPGAGIILMHTRYHEDDLAGRLLGIEGDEWTVLRLPAVADSVDDPLGRVIGEPLWADDAYGYGAKMLRERDALARRGATREWQSQYQQNPRPPDGTLFKTAHIETLDIVPDLTGARIGSGWDFGATRKIGTNDPDFTVRVKLARLRTGRYVVLDVFRDRGDPDENDRWLQNVSTQDRLDTPGVKISIPQDPGQAGKTQVLHRTRLLSGHQIESSPETGDKADRAGPVISQCNGGNLAIVRGPWNRAFLDELAAFPNGAKDDQVDALSRAFSIVGLQPKAINVSNDLLAAMRMRRR